MADIQQTHSEYDRWAPTWEKIADCIAGEEAIKAKREQYLPFPVAMTDAYRATPEFAAEYEVYLQGALFEDLTGQAVGDLSAGVFRKPPIINELPTDLEYLPIGQTARKIVTLVTSYGRAFVMTDYPVVDGTVSLAEEEENGIRAYLTIYEPLDIINWETSYIGGTETLTRIVLQEGRNRDENIEEDDSTVKYRELLLDGGIYKVRTYNDNGDLIQETIPVGDGQPFNRIPGVLVGVVSNTSEIDKPPVLGIANTNIKHYQTWAELSHTQVNVGHPAIAVTGAPNGFIKKMTEEDFTLSVGASQALVFEGPDADVKLLEINASNLIHFKTLEELKRSMQDQGARLRSQTVTGGAETAEAIRLRNAADISTMASIAGQVEDALTEVIRYAAQYMAITLPETFEVRLNKVFVEEQPDSQVGQFLSSIVSAGQVPNRVLYDYLKRTGLLSEDEDYELLSREAEEEKQEPVIDPAADSPTD